jgi:electron transfer flavoprotein beta subunit
MNLVVCLKRVPDTTTKIRIGPDRKSIDAQGVEFVISPYDELAIEVALRLREKSGSGEAVGLSVDPEGNETAMRKALAIGLDRGVLVRGGLPFDGFPVAQILAEQLRKIPFDLVLFGKQSIDSDSYQVPTMVAHLLGLPRANVCTRLEVEGGRARCARQIEGGEESLDLALPCVVSVQKGVNGIHDPRYPSLKGIMAAKKKTIETVPAPPLEPRLEIQKMDLPPDRPPGRIVGKGVEAVPELVRLLREEAKVL